MRTRHSIDLLVVDYLQLVRSEDPRQPREQQVAAVSRGLKLLAKELDIPVLALAQLNRQVEKRAGGRATALVRLAGIRVDRTRRQYCHVSSPRPGRKRIRRKCNRRKKSKRPNGRCTSQMG
jgi:replicative DNA helicase